MENTALEQAFMEWKVAYGLAVHGNYTFALPSPEVLKRWNRADRAEQTFSRLLSTLSCLIKSKTLLHIIEADINALGNEIDRCKASSTPERPISTHMLEIRVQQAYALAADVVRLSSAEDADAAKPPHLRVGVERDALHEMRGELD